MSGAPANLTDHLWMLLLEDIEERTNPIKLSPAARAAYVTLVDAMEHHRPACSDDYRFTNGSREPFVLARVCGACPIRTECGTYAELAQPRAGYWAGQTYEERP